MRTLLLLGLVLCCPALAQAVLPLPPLPLPDRVEYERGIEWGAYHAETRLVLERQPDGSYLAEVSGERQQAKSGVRIPADRLHALRAELDAMRGFPDEGFGGTGNHGYTSLKVDGPQGQRLKRFFFDTNVPALDARAKRLHDAVLGVIATQPAPAPAPATIQRLVYERGIEWAGDHAQVRIELTRQADGSYRATVGGEDVTAVADAPVSAAQLAELQGSLDAFRGFSQGSNAGDGNHWYTRFTLEGTEPDGSSFSETRDAYDPSSSSGMREVSALEGIVTRLAQALAPAPSSGGLSGALPK